MTMPISIFPVPFPFQVSLSSPGDFSIRFIELRDARIGRPGTKRGRDKEEQTVRLRLTKFRSR
jgi:hypothetical protein